MGLPLTIAIVTGALGLLLVWIYRWLTSNYGYWEAQGIPTIKPKPLIGNLGDFFGKTPIEIEEGRWRKYGKLYGTYEFFTRVVNVADPELVKLVLVKDFHVFTNRRNFKTKVPVLDQAMTAVRDETWKRIRTVVSPSFTSGKLRKMNCHFVNAAEGLVSNLAHAASSGELIDPKVYFSSYSLDVIGLCAFGVQVDSLKHPEDEFTVNANKFFRKDFSLMFFALFMPGFSRLFGGLILKKMGFQFFIDTAEEIIQKTKAMKEKNAKVNLIQLLLDARDGKDEGTEKEEPQSHLYQETDSSVPRPSWNVTKTLSDAEIHAQTTQIFAAGHDTVSTGLAFAAYELALNPEIQEKLFQEVRDAFETHGEFSYDVVSRMSYLEAVISETLRLHTIGVRIERQASEEYVLGSTGIVVPKGGVVMVLAHVIHHDPEWWPEPYKFDPDRFLPENHDSITPYTFLPFSVGPRNCVAMRFALLEMKLCLAMVVRKIRFVATEETRAPIEYFKNPALLSPKNMKMCVETRE